MVKLNNSNIQQILEHKDNFTQKLVRNIKHISAHHLRSLPQPHFGMIFLKSNIKETIYGRTETSIIIVQPHYIRNEPCMPYYLAVVIAFRGLYLRDFFYFLLSSLQESTLQSTECIVFVAAKFIDSLTSRSLVTQLDLGCLTDAPRAFCFMHSTFLYFFFDSLLVCFFLGHRPRIREILFREDYYLIHDYYFIGSLTLILSTLSLAIRGRGLLGQATVRISDN